MRLKQSRLKQYYHKSAVTSKDEEGNTDIYYAVAMPIVAEVWPAAGKLQAERYGQRVDYIKNCRIDSAYKVITDEKGNVSYVLNDSLAMKEGDGICINVSTDVQPDYKIISIKPYRYLYLELERL